MSDAPNEITQFRTANLALSATLNMEGHRHDRLEAMDGAAVWVFSLTPEGMELVADFEDKILEVEPRGFMGALKRTRDELYKFLDREGLSN